VKRKLKSSRGETLVELLASILIASLSVVLVFGSIMASAVMDRQAQELDEDYYEALSMAERQSGADKLTLPAGTVSRVTVSNANIATSPFFPVPVIFYGGKGAVSYVLDTP